MKKTVRLVTLFLAALALVLSAGTLPAAAAAPGNTFPGGSAFVDNQTHSISPNASLWYSFNYAGDRSVITLTLVNGNNSGVGFDVFTPGQIGDWWDVSPIGRGTPQATNCSSGIPETGGACQANDLTWVGNFPESGTYYVEVVNNNAGTASFQLTIAGSGVSMMPKMSVMTTTSGATTTTTSNPPSAVPAASNMDPGHAAVMDNNSHLIPANTGLWYRFDYVADHSLVTIRMPNGVNSGLGFKVFAQGQIGDWWDATPVGQGTTQGVNCSDVVPDERGNCQSNDLSWTGSFNNNGTFYVELFNNNGAATLGQLVIQGDGVALAQ